MLSEEMTGRLVNEIRRFLIADAATLSKANDEQLRRRIADIIDHKLVNYRIALRSAPGSYVWYSVPSVEWESWMRSLQMTVLQRS